MDAAATCSNKATGIIEVISSASKEADFSAVYISGLNTLFDNNGIMKIQLKAPVAVKHGLVLTGNSNFNSQNGSTLEVIIIQ